MAKNTKIYQEPTHAEIAACAHHIYETEGRPSGKATEHWLQAEAQLIAKCKAAAGLPPASTNPPKPGGQLARRENWQTPSRHGLHHN